MTDGILARGKCANGGPVAALFFTAGVAQLAMTVPVPMTVVMATTFFRKGLVLIHNFGQR